MADTVGFVAPALYLITDRHATGGRPLTEVVAAALRGAAGFRRPDGRLHMAVSLREKDLPGADLHALATELVALTRAAGADLYVNGRLDVALACDAEGVHLPGNDLVPGEVRAIAPQLHIGVSTHTIDEVQAAARDGAHFVVFGPVFETASKTGLIPTRGLTGLAEASNTAIPVLALGGITPERAGACRISGARGLACIGAVMRAPDPESETRAFLARFFGRN